jgi:hypothetical protein
MSGCYSFSDEAGMRRFAHIPEATQ